MVGGDSDIDDFSGNDDVDPAELESGRARPATKGTRKSTQSPRTPKKVAGSARGKSSLGSKVETPNKPATRTPRGNGIKKQQGSAQSSKPSVAKTTPIKSRATSHKDTTSADPETTLGLHETHGPTK